MLKNSKISQRQEQMYLINVNEDYSVNNTILPYPPRWLYASDENKRISFRRLSVRNKEFDFSFKMKLYYYVQEEDEWVGVLSPLGELIEFDENWKITNDTTFEEIVFNIEKELEKWTEQLYNNETNSYELQIGNIKKIILNTRPTFEQVYSNKRKYSLQITGVIDNEQEKYICNFLYIRFENVDENILKSLFQADTPDKIKRLTEFPVVDVEAEDMFSSIYYSDIWNRDYLYCHTSFSESHSNYLCMSNDFNDKANKVYLPPTNDSTFMIWFSVSNTSDSIIRPTLTNILLELSYIYDNSTTLITYK